MTELLMLEVTSELITYWVFGYQMENMVASERRLLKTCFLPSSYKK